MKKSTVLLSSVLAASVNAADFSLFADGKQYDAPNGADLITMGAGLEVKLDDHVSLVGTYAVQESASEGVDLDGVATASIRIGKTFSTGVMAYVAPTYVSYNPFAGGTDETVGYSLGISSNVNNVYVGIEYTDLESDVTSVGFSLGYAF